MSTELWLPLELTALALELRLPLKLGLPLELWLLGLLLLLGHGDLDATGLRDEVVHACLVQLDLLDDLFRGVGVLFLGFLFTLFMVIQDL